MIGKSFCAATLLLAAVPAALAQDAPAGVEITVPGPEGNLAGTLIDPDPKAPLLLIVPGSGPTDRDGNNRYGVAGGPYRQLAEALAKRGVATLRIDKRGMFGSKAAVADPTRVTITDYAADTRAWIDAARQRTGRACVWLGGHSEGGLVELVAAQNPQGVCGVVLIGAAGRPLATIMREQFRGNPGNAPFLDSALGMIDAFEAGKHVDPATLVPPLPQLFPERVQDFLIDEFRYDPPKLAAALKVPLLVVQGDRDVQINPGDAQALAGANPAAKRAIIPDMTHVLRIAAGEGFAASTATYGNAALPVAPALVDAVAGFVTAKR
ncbi:alpha/beta fold hydrolase [Sphingomonas sp. HITSZ_GF]|uniref:alpha/beta hydrolase n=1 Tax=Sphingomonas sp. HITSZ_GF TaxID=3037247 RepID=UPI00240DFDD1|nr:alpha/beta fold hydrolase [Sphingomonas sp. HITSZ_GF]MDG2534651.1 alpha/beta fold hydrolase [Sphingomonas sp. HITSZ_GF]